MSPEIIVLLAAFLIIWLICGILITQASIYLHEYRNLDSQIHRAWVFCLAASLMTWIIVALAVIMIILAIVGVGFLFSTGEGEAATAAEATEATKVPGTKHASWVVVGSLLASMVVITIIGILAIFAAKALADSPNYNPEQNPRQRTAHSDTVIVAILAIGSIAILLAGVIGYMIGYHKSKTTIQATPGSYPIAITKL